MIDAESMPRRMSPTRGLRFSAACLAAGIFFASLAGAAERDPVLEVMQAQCIQEGMVRGNTGESLKSFVNRCVEVKRHAPPPEFKHFSADPAAC